RSDARSTHTIGRAIAIYSNIFSGDAVASVTVSGITSASAAARYCAVASADQHELCAGIVPFSERAQQYIHTAILERHARVGYDGRVRRQIERAARLHLGARKIDRLIVRVGNDEYARGGLPTCRDDLLTKRFGERNDAACAAQRHVVRALHPFPQPRAFRLSRMLRF